MKISTNIQAKARIPLAIAILGLAGLGFEVSGIKTEVKNAKNDAITAGNLSKEDIKKMEALVHWEIGRNYGIIDCYKEFNNKLLDKKTVEEIIKEKLVQEKESDLQKQIQRIDEYYKRTEADIFEHTK